MWQPHEFTYCSNLHPGESLAAIEHNLAHYFAPVRTQRRLETMHSGLWLSDQAAKQLQQPKALQQFQQSLRAHGVLLTSLNGFPFGGFHQKQVKHSVYLPDWSLRARLQYTQNLAQILAACLPDHIHSGVISTLPLGYQAVWTPEKQQAAIRQLLTLEDFLTDLQQKTGKHIRVCIEMEPDCVLESTEQLVAFFQALSVAHGQMPQFLGACFDVCHQAVMFEDCYQSLHLLQQAGIEIGKIQFSNAIQLDSRDLLRPNSNLETSPEPSLATALGAFAEQQYLHQVKGLTASGERLSSSDLALALSASPTQRSSIYDAEQWRIHFHVPLNATQFNHSGLLPLHQELRAVVQYLADHQPICHPYLEIETYSWHVLPESMQPQNDAQLIEGIIREIDWLTAEFHTQALLSCADSSQQEYAHG